MPSFQCAVLGLLDSNLALFLDSYMYICRVVILTTPSTIKVTWSDDGARIYNGLKYVQVQETERSTAIDLYLK